MALLRRARQLSLLLTSRIAVLAPDDSRWSKHSETLRAVAGALRKLGSTGSLPVAVSTLRGELADNEEWKADPARPAIIVGTIDMIGSKLLFSGYGDGRYRRSQHAGLIGQDSFIIVSAAVSHQVSSPYRLIILGKDHSPLVFQS